MLTEIARLREVHFFPCCEGAFLEKSQITCCKIHINKNNLTGPHEGASVVNSFHLDSQTLGFQAQDLRSTIQNSI